MTSKDELIREHKRIKITEINVLRTQKLTYNDCLDEITIRRFCAYNKKTLPDMIEVEVSKQPDDNAEHEWRIVIYENPNDKHE